MSVARAFNNAKRIAIALSALLAAMLAAAPVWAAQADDWDIDADIKRLISEVPSIAAFEGADGVVWHDFREYEMLADGSMMKRRREIFVLADGAPEELMTVVLPFPDEEGAELSVGVASWYDIRTGAPRGDMPAEIREENGVKYALVKIPPVAAGCVIAIEHTAISPMNSHIDGIAELSGPMPVWEQMVSVKLPAGMELYWEGEGIRSPERETAETGVETVSWKLFNQPARAAGGMVARRPPSVIFSLRHGIDGALRRLAAAEAKFKAPPMPRSVASARGTARAGEAIDSYLGERILRVNGVSPRVIRSREAAGADGPWTEWEASLIAARWFAELGHPVSVFWSQKFPVRTDGPDSSEIWARPVLRIEQGSGKSDIFYTAGTPAAFGGFDSTVAGAQLCRLADGSFERLRVPAGNAPDHALRQNWRMTLDENGDAEGTLELFAGGRWASLLGFSGAATGADMCEIAQSALNFPYQAFGMELKSVKESASGVRAVFTVRAKLGLASGGDMLVKIPGGAPFALADIPDDGSEYSFSFPFTIEQNAVITTPPGFRVIQLPAKEADKGGQSTLDSSVIHWPKKRSLEASFKWTVRSTTADELARRAITAQATAAINWARTPVPFRKSSK